MKTRHYIFEQAGFDVTSAWGFSEAINQCKNGKFDVVVLGHTLPPQDKTMLVSSLRDKCHCPIVSIRKPGQSKHPDADYSVDAGEGPQAMLAAVREAVGQSG
jgi:DNA-binding response OmpR family regulator